MALINCHECEKEISSEAKTCPNCGAKRKSTIRLPLVAIIIAFVFLGIVFVGKDFQPSEKDKAREVIATCWKEQSKKSFAPKDQRFLASVCEEFEADFIKRYGVKP